ncbi:ester cyclase [Kitasatospora sp. NPDC127111]|uniref:ester cyclase n=1 Tax=Kitasatospora sp. NPDC127111 TaxID=3345363 RepID=UPI00362F7E77
MGMSAEDAARGLFTVLATGDAALAAAVVHEDFTNREAVVAPAACSLPGPAGVLASGAWLRSAFTDLSFPVTDLAHDGDQVWIRLRMRGRHTGPFVHYRDGTLLQAIPPTGGEIDSEQVHVLHLRDRKVVRHEAVRDDLGLLGQLGIFPAGATVQLIRDWHESGRAASAAARIAEAAERAAATAHEHTSG